MLVKTALIAHYLLKKMKLKSTVSPRYLSANSLFHIGRKWSKKDNFKSKMDLRSKIAERIYRE
jgi:hypothetical protein